jgi:hypothetical protein
MKFPIIADSGANQHMFKELQFFESMRPATGKVILGDGVTSLAIRGIGTVKLCIDGCEHTRILGALVEHPQGNLEEIQQKTLQSTQEEPVGHRDRKA